MASIDFEALSPAIKELYEMELPEEEWEEIVYFQDYVKSPRVQQEHHQFRDVFAKGRMPDRKGDDQNLRFFRNTLKCRPDGMFLDEIHRDWQEDYEGLEYRHGYIQWLFPLPVAGMNFEAQPLQQHEAEAIASDPEAKARLLRSYRLMLNFYGMMLDNEDTGAVSRGQNYKSRYRNLSTNAHNWLRITRIMKCLGLLGFPHFVAPFLSFLVQEMLAGRLCRLGGSLRGFFVETLLNDNDRIALLSFLAQFD